MDRKVYSVSKIITYLRSMVQEDLFCRHITIRGEISDVRYHNASGHTYFILREGDNQLSCILYAGDRRGQSIKPEDGKEMECEGEITFYHKPARFTFRVRKLELSGEGRIYEEYLKTRQEMEEAGMFSEQYKRKIPRLVRKLGVLSSASGDVRRDIESVAKRRNPFLEIVLCPVYVQGEKAVPSLIAGLSRILLEEPDAIIIARGGGSDCDMEVFNSRELAEAVFNSPVPIVSAIGHTPYVPILNMVADKAAGTPSEAAEKVTCDIYELMAQVGEKQTQLQQVMLQVLSRKRSEVSALGLRLEKRSPKAMLLSRRLLVEDAKKRMEQSMREQIHTARGDLLQIPGKMTDALREGCVDYRRKTDRMAEKMTTLITDRAKQSRTAIERRDLLLHKNFETLLSRKKHDLGLLCVSLDSASPLKRISAGYAFVETKSGKGAAGIGDLKTGEGVKLYLHDGYALADITEVGEGGLNWEDNGNGGNS